jgi:hypothetical protein
MLKLRSKLESEIMQASDATLQEKGEEKASIEKTIPDIPGAPTEIHQASEVTEAEGMKETTTGGEPVIAGEDSALPAPGDSGSGDGTASITGKKHPAAGSAKKGTASKKAKQR